MLSTLCAFVLPRRRSLFRGSRMGAQECGGNMRKKIPRYGFRIVGIKQEKEGGKRQKPKGASKR